MHTTNISGPDAESCLFRRWLKEGRVDNVYFSDDGIVSESDFDYWTPRIVFVLKEVHAGTGFSLRSFLAAGAFNEAGYKDGSYTWAPVQRWLVAYGKAMGGSDRIKSGQQNRQSVLRTVAAINLKKTPGGAVNNFAEMLSWVREHRDMIQEQVRSYYGKPTVFVCCGDAVYNLFSEAMEISRASPIKLDGIDFKKLSENAYVFNVRHHPNKSNRKVHDARFVKAMLAIKKHIAEALDSTHKEGKASWE